MTSMDLYLGLAAVGSGCAASLAVLPVGEGWDRLGRWQMGKLADRFRRLGLGETRMRLILCSWGAALFAVPPAIWFTMHAVPIAATAMFLIYVAPRHLLDYLNHRRSRKLRDQIVPATQSLANSLRAGLSLADGLLALSTEAPMPLRREIRDIVFRYESGRPLRESIADVRERLDLETFSTFALAIETALSHGGRITEALDRISRSLEEQQRLERKLEADVAGGRHAVILLTCVPPGFAALFYFFDAETVSLLWKTTFGQIATAVAIGLTYLGGRWAASICRLDLT